MDEADRIWSVGDDGDLQPTLGAIGHNFSLGASGDVPILVDSARWYTAVRPF